MVNTDDYDNGAFFSGKITKSILRKRKVVKIKRKKVVKIKKNKMLIQRSKNRNKSKSIKHGKKLFGGSVTKVKQRQVRNIPSYSTRSLNNTSNRNNNYRTTSKLSLSKVLSTARQLTPEQQARTANCINYVFNIIGGPRGPVGPAGKDGTAGGATAQCNGYFIDQNLRTTDGVTFNTVEATTSYSLASVSVTGTQWGYLANMDQDVSTSAGVTFNTVNGRDIAVDGSNLDALTSIGLTGLTTAEVNQLKNIDTTTISTTQWEYLGAMDQYVGTTADVTFNTVEATSSYSLNSVSVTGTQWGYLENMDQDVNTTADITFNTVTATTSYSLGSTTIDATTWNYLASIDQDLSTTSGVTFNSVTITDGNNLILRDGQVYMNSPSTTAIDFYTLNIKRLTISDTSLIPATTDDYNIGSNSLRFRTLYLGTSIDLGGTAIGTTGWNHLATIDQDLATTDDVNFNSVTVADGERVNLISSGQVYITSPSTTAMEFYTESTLKATLSNTSYFPGGDNTQDLGASNRVWKTLYLGSTADLAGTPIGTTQWNCVTFNSVSVPFSASTSNIRLSTVSDTGFYASDANTIKINILGNHRYTFQTTVFNPENDDYASLGTSIRQWKNLYLAQKANVGQLNISNPTVPGTTSATGTAGDIAWDANYIYVCIATNSWKRAPIVLIFFYNYE
jgi:hypothetical protein